MILEFQVVKHTREIEVGPSGTTLQHPDIFCLKPAFCSGPGADNGAVFLDELPPLGSPLGSLCAYTSPHAYDLGGHYFIDLEEQADGDWTLVDVHHMFDFDAMSVEFELSKGAGVIAHATLKMFVTNPKAFPLFDGKRGTPWRVSISKRPDDQASEEAP